MGVVPPVYNSGTPKFTSKAIDVSRRVVSIVRARWTTAVRATSGTPA